MMISASKEASPQNRIAIESADTTSTRELIRKTLAHEVMGQLTNIAATFNDLEDDLEAVLDSGKIEQTGEELSGTMISQLSSLKQSLLETRELMLLVNDTVFDIAQKIKSTKEDVEDIIDQSELASEIVDFRKSISLILNEYTNVYYFRPMLERLNRQRLNIERLINISTDIFKGRNEDEPERIKFSKLAEDLRTQFSLIKQSYIKINDRSATFLGYREELISAVSNLIRNGLDYNNSVQPLVYVDVAAGLPDINDEKFELRIKELNLHGKNNFYIEVNDNGRGIPEAQRSKVLQPFYRIGADGQMIDARKNQDFEKISGGRESITSLSDKRGLGIGLTIVQRVAEMHGGLLWIGDNQPQGTRVFLILPQNS